MSLDFYCGKKVHKSRTFNWWLTGPEFYRCFYPPWLWVDRSHFALIFSVIDEQHGCGSIILSRLYIYIFLFCLIWSCKRHWNCPLKSRYNSRRMSSYNKVFYVLLVCFLLSAEQITVGRHKCHTQDFFYNHFYSIYLFYTFHYIFIGNHIT